MSEQKTATNSLTCLRNVATAGVSTARTSPVAAIVLGLTLWVSSTDQALAQGSPNIQTVQQISWLDAGLFAALVGGALFAVCRASSRM